jgi:hypothetical protein
VRAVNAARGVSVPGSARISRVGFGVSPKQSLEKSAMTRRHRQHARRARYPELLLNSCELVGRDSIEPGELTAPQSIALPFKARKQWDRFPNNMSIR